MSFGLLQRRGQWRVQRQHRRNCAAQPVLLHARCVLMAVGATLLTAASGCHSAFVETTIKNNGPTPIHVIEVDYPSASFGTQTLAARSEYNYRFKIQGSGPVKLSYDDDKGALHTSAGPALVEGEEGGLTIAIDGGNRVSWSPALHPRK